MVPPNYYRKKVQRILEGDDMTDKEIIQALRCCEKEVCADGGLCPLFSDADCIVHLGEAAIDLIERLTAANAELREKRRWIPVTERLPEERALVNVVWVNRAPEPYYKKIKGVPFSGTACFYRGRWYWDSPVVLDLLAEYGEDEIDLVDEAVEVTHWMPLPEASEVDL
uniref:DUF551 domain-containing protein n=2 Tax=unclassified Caudoviricetes TaxID=2788787 RepID=A0A8S5VC67_9CAUD|nr:MAG TPA: Protein of unknown function (DUF551) [Siphoviridae sp. ctHDv29]DAG04223.1 MAG TPA: Protein of unknown function (DUF551) [Siphoviridae sp. ctKsH2]